MLREPTLNPFRLRLIPRILVQSKMGLGFYTLNKFSGGAAGPGTTL